jgi:hypothetical protein
LRRRDRQEYIQSSGSGAVVPLSHARSLCDTIGYELAVSDSRVFVARGIF